MDKGVSNLTDDRNVDDILENFTQFWGRLAEEFPPKDSYEIYRDKAKSAQNKDEALNFMHKSVSEAKKMISKNALEGMDGETWLSQNARPYIMMRKELAEMYVYFRLIDEAVKEYFDILDMDAFDNLNIRGNLASLLLNENRYEDFERLISNYW